ncbi:tetratricopeptide repeat protein [Candidatus Neomarinimicrobiota bacterium]
MKMSRNLIAGVVILGSMLAPLIGQDLEAQIATAKAAMEAEDWASAQVTWQAIVADNPANAEAHYLLSKTALQTGDLKTAQTSIAAALEEDGRNTEYREHADIIAAISSSMTKARRLLDENDPDGAIAEYEQLLTQHPYLASAQYAMGMAYKRTENLRQAAKAFRAARDLDPGNSNYSNALRNLVAEKYNSANRLYKNRNWGPAINAYLEAIDLEPTFHPAYYQLAKAQKYDGDNIAALATLDKILAFKPDYVNALVEKGDILVKEGQEAEAEQAYRLAISFDAGSDQAYVGLGSILRNTDENAAINAFESAIAANNKSSAAHEFLGEIYSGRENWTKAQAHLEKATQLKPKDYRTAWRLAVVYNSTQNYEQARLMAKKSTDIRKSFEYGWYEKGIAEKALGNRQAAIVAFRQAEKGRDSAIRKSAKYELAQLTSNGN